MFHSFFDMLDHWQALIAGEIAILAAVLTFVGVYWLSRDDRRRKLRASRALLPAALSLMSDYAELSVEWLKALRPLIGLPINITAPPATRIPDPPEPDSRIFDILKDCIEHADEGPARSMADMLSAMQVFRSRIIGIAGRYPYSGGRVLLEREVDQQMRDAVILRASTDRLFTYARMESEEPPQALDWNAVATAFKVMGLGEYTETDVWNALADKYAAHSKT